MRSHYKIKKNLERLLEKGAQKRGGAGTDLPPALLAQRGKWGFLESPLMGSSANGFPALGAQRRQEPLCPRAELRLEWKGGEGARESQLVRLWPGESQEPFRLPCLFP